jgi:thymidylate synthase ThyX
MTAEMDISSLKGKRIGVLDDGFVELVDWMGSDAAIVQAARVSYGEGTKRISQDRGLKGDHRRGASSFHAFAVSP